ncbi:MAG: GTPase Era [Alphaproteobacteria bacterium TMED93]|nr:MAG: GTPase Era [Alphaproteobacteria bacterium TMED93]
MKKKLVQTIKLSIVGETNVGKSTLLNNIFKKKLSIVSRKAQTTIKQKTGIFYFNDKQFIFLDTPGIFGSNMKLSRSTFKQASNSILESNLVLLILDATKNNLENSLEIIKYIKTLEKQVLIVINKIDLLKKKDYLQKIENIQKVLNSKKLITISAIKFIGVKSLLSYIEKNFDFFYKEVVTNKNNAINSDFVEEIVREKILNTIHEEVPYNLKFKTESILKKNDGSYIINVSIIVKKNSQKPIIIGKSGEKIKKISTSARYDLEKIYKKKIHLFLYIKVKKNRQKIDNMER